MKKVKVTTDLMYVKQLLKMAKDLIGASEIMLMMQITSRGGGVLC